MEPPPRHRRHHHHQTPHQEQELSLEQSLQLVMIFMNASLACICYTRELLRWNSPCFRIRYIEQVCLVGVEPCQIYSTFLTAPADSAGNCQEVRVLARGASVGANHVLNMLEHGVFDAIKRAYLDTLHVIIAKDADETREILETYTFRFKYDKGRISTIQLADTEQAFNLRRSQKSFKAAIRGLLRAMQGMPRLHSNRVLGMTMSYTPECPDSYEPDTFTEASDHGIDSRHWDDLWQETSSSTACFETAHHTVEASARRMPPLSPPGSLAKDAIISRQLQNMQTTSSSHNLALQATQLPTNYLPEKRKDDDRDVDAGQPTKRSKGLDLAAIQDSSPADPDSSCRPERHEDVCVDLNAGAASRRKRSISKLFVPMDSTPDSKNGNDVY